MSRFQSPNPHDRSHDSYQDRSGSGRPYQPRGEGNRSYGQGGGNYGNREHGGQGGNRSYGQGGGNYGNREHGGQGNRSYGQGGGNYGNREHGGQGGNRSYGQGGGNYGNREHGGQGGNRSYGQGGGNYGNREHGGQGGNRSYGQGGGNYSNREHGGQGGNRSYGQGGGNYGNRERYDRQGGPKRYPQKSSEPIDPKLLLPMELPESLFRIPTHPLTLAFQRAIGMAKGKVIEVNPKKNRGVLEIDGFQYKFEDNRRADMQRKYPIARFLEKEIMFSFWPTYSQKAAQYRKIDEAPTIKIANLRQMLPKNNAVEIIGEIFLIEETLFVISLFSQTQKKKYFVTVCGKYVGQPGDIIQMEGHLEQGSIHYDSHKVLHSGAVAP